MKNLPEKSAAVFLLISALAFSHGCCRKAGDSQGSTPGSGRRVISETAGQAGAGEKNGVADRPAELLEKTGLNYSIDASRTARKNVPAPANSFFETQYLRGVELMEKGDFTKAIELFDELIQRYPNTEEASIAELCIAELFFRNKSNDRALKAYERIVENYPNSHAAENARAGIAYLKNFERYEQEHIAPDVEARKRRGY
mgnify:CR=1 FL=1